MADQTPAQKKTCPECGGQDIVAGISVTLSDEPGRVGLNYNRPWIFGSGTEPLCADLCRRCGTIVRFFVKDTAKPWTQP